MKSCICVILLLGVLPAYIFAQAPQISYLIPDIGTPGMNTYVEIVGPNNQDGNFGNDGLYLNNPGEAVQVVCVDPSDSQYVRFGPCVVGWNGKLISTQAFVLPNATPNSWNWQTTNLKIPIQILVNGSLTNSDTFYIVQQQNVGILNTPGSIGSGGTYGLRSKRGAMIVDSVILNGNGAYTVSTQDCDPYTTGNQGYLPAVIISRGKITISTGSSLSMSATNANGAPGGGGGGAADVAAPGSGFSAGGSDCCYPGSGQTQYGTGTGPSGNSLNGCLGGDGDNFDQGGGGGTGFPFGTSGAMGHDGNVQDFSSLGGYGAGSSGGEKGNIDIGKIENYGAEFGGGGAGNANSGMPGVGKGNNAGLTAGNLMIVPLAGGSGGGAGNQNNGGKAGSGGGGGGGLSLQSNTLITMSSIESKGFDGVDGTYMNGYHAGLFPSSGAGGGGGAGGNILLGARLSISSTNSINLAGGSGGTAADPSKQASCDGGSGSAGRLRVDGPGGTQIKGMPNSASVYAGPSTDTSTFVPRSFTLTGTGNGQSIRIYLRPLSGPWYLAATVSNYGTSWSTPITLPGTDSIYLLAAAQDVPSPSTAEYTSEPAWILSQSAANILRIGCSPPVAQIAGAPIILKCSGRDTLLTVLPAGMNYKWFDSKGDSLSTAQSIAVLNEDTYKVIVTNSSGCSDAATVQVQSESVAASASPSPLKMCSGGDTMLTAAPGMAAYRWFDSLGTTLSDSASLRVTQAGIYKLVASNALGCSDSAFDTVSYFPTTIASIIPNADTIFICDKSSTILKASGGNSYLWNTGEKTDSITVSDTGSFFFVDTDANGCTATSKSVTVRWIPAPDVVVQAPNDTTICSLAGGLYAREIVLKNNLPIPQKLYVNQTGSDFHGIDSIIVVGPGADTILLDSMMTDGSTRTYSTTCYFQDSCDTRSYSAAIDVNAGLPPQLLSIELAANSALSTGAGDTVRVPVLIYSNACISKLRFSVAHDSDMLGYLGADSTQVRLDSANSGREYCTLLAPPDSGIACDLMFRSFLARQDSTPITISILGYDSTCLPCVSSDSTQGTSVSLVYGCGGELLREVLSGAPIILDRIVPNPARDAITVSFTKPDALPIHYEIRNALGAMVMSGETAANTLTLSTQGLPAGVFEFRASSNGFVEARRFVVEK